MAAVPPAYDESDQGPLCRVFDTFEALERIARTAAFGTLYSTMCLVEAPSRYTVPDVTLTVCRAVAASVWALAVNRTLLLLAPVQVTLAAWKRIQLYNRAYASVSNDSEVGTDDDDDLEAGDVEDDSDKLSGPAQAPSLAADFARTPSRVPHVQKQRLFACPHASAAFKRADVANSMAAYAARA